ncbi:hypothetical protein M885DRAFT_493633 [Pelagophyceae sp. CCMP2097]|nr:hypothetical protein M885DRAFT_493633 [Pelagophyceae sp. CCMP2097]
MWRCALAAALAAALIRHAGSAAAGVGSLVRPPEGDGALEYAHPLLRLRFDVAEARRIGREWRAGWRLFSAGKRGGARPNEPVDGLLVGLHETLLYLEAAASKVRDRKWVAAALGGPLLALQNRKRAARPPPAGLREVFNDWRDDYLEAAARSVDAETCAAGLAGAAIGAIGAAEQAGRVLLVDPIVEELLRDPIVEAEKMDRRIAAVCAAWEASPGPAVVQVVLAAIPGAATVCAWAAWAAWADLPTAAWAAWLGAGRARARLASCVACADGGDDDAAVASAQRRFCATRSAYLLAVDFSVAWLLLAALSRAVAVALRLVKYVLFVLLAAAVLFVLLLVQYVLAASLADISSFHDFLTTVCGGGVLDAWLVLGEMIWLAWVSLLARMRAVPSFLLGFVWSGSVAMVPTSCRLAVAFALVPWTINQVVTALRPPAQVARLYAKAACIYHVWVSPLASLAAAAALAACIAWCVKPAERRDLLAARAAAARAADAQRTDCACAVCLDDPAQALVTFSPCGHRAVCVACAEKIGRRCPLCRAVVQQRHVVLGSTTFRLS